MPYVAWVPKNFFCKIYNGFFFLYRFVPREDVFKMDFEKYPDNKCFCDGEELCDMIGDGMFAVPKCQFDAPIVLSWPHFLHANETFQKSVTGNFNTILYF